MILSMALCLKWCFCLVFTKQIFVWLSANICTVCPHSALYSKIFGKFIEATQSEQSIVIIHLHTNNISIQCRIDYCLVSGLLMIDFARVFIRFYKKVESQTTNMDLFVIFFYTNSKKNQQNTRNEFHYGI